MSNAQHALDVARGHIVALLQHDGIKKPVLPALHATNNPASDERDLTSTLNIAVTKYGSKASARDMTYAAIAGLLSSTGDRYTTFLSPKEYAELNAGLDAQAFGGVGLSIGIDDATKAAQSRIGYRRRTGRKGWDSVRRHGRNDRREAHEGQKSG